VHQFPEHPDISTALATGYPKRYKPILCDTCKEAVQPGEHYGEFDGRIICTDCIEDEWKELTASEKFERLGYDSKFNG
jgi:formylmethanofuran dehydrogenase subunit E